MMKNDMPSDNELRQFGWLMGLVIIGLFAFLLPWIWNFPGPRWPWVVALLFWGCAWFRPSALGPVYRGWMKVGRVLGWFNTHLLMGLVFFLLVMPMGLVLRLFGKTQIQRNQKNQVDSFRQTSAQRQADHFKRLF